MVNFSRLRLGKANYDSAKSVLFVPCVNGMHARPKARRGPLSNCTSYCSGSGRQTLPTCCRIFLGARHAGMRLATSSQMTFRQCAFPGSMRGCMVVGLGSTGKSSHPASACLRRVGSAIVEKRQRSAK